jgi:hypothetical protein
MIKNPHPSGRPIRGPKPKKSAVVWYRYPAETFATPRLRAQPSLPVADAIGFKAVRHHSDEDHTTGPEARQIGFVHFQE